MSLLYRVDHLPGTGWGEVSIWCTTTITYVHITIARSLCSNSILLGTNTVIFNVCMVLSWLDDNAEAPSHCFVVLATPCVFCSFYLPYVTVATEGQGHGSMCVYRSRPASSTQSSRGRSCNSSILNGFLYYVHLASPLDLHRTSTPVSSPATSTQSSTGTS